MYNKNKKYLIGLWLLSFIIYGAYTEITPNMKQTKNNSTNKKMILVLAAPSIHNTYYQEYFEEIVDFQIAYAKAIRGNDEVRILVDQDTIGYYNKALSKEILITANMYDIWMRDFTTVNPKSPVQFVYTAASMTRAQSRKTQKLFDNFADDFNITRQKSSYVIDGGNIVDNYNGKAITTTRFLEDNNINIEEGKTILKELLNLQEVAIIEPDDEVLAHADGMVAWIDDDVLLVNDYRDIDISFHKRIMTDLRTAFPLTKIIEIPVEFDDRKVDKTKGISSACGVHLNLVLTYKNIYVPIFNTDNDSVILNIIKKNTNKKVIPINAENICLFGGSVRCTVWQIDSFLGKELLSIN